MAKILKGAPVAASLNDKIRRDVLALEAAGTKPRLAILRVGTRPDDLAYERSIMKLCSVVNIGVRCINLPEDVHDNTFYSMLEDMNTDMSIHGILMFRPLPDCIDSEKARNMIRPEKDVDGCTDASLVGVFTGRQEGYDPCTAQAVMEILKYYNIPIEGRRAAVVGRSLVVGRPVAMMLLKENATVTLCHTRTPDISAETSDADIIVACTGHAGSVGEECFSDGQTVIDVGINWDEQAGKMCGDVDYDGARPIVSAITPVPGGVGSVTTSVLLTHVTEAAKRLSQ
ncbi:MAG: bifunctional 5,10-methylenetetrahydrofolate dehydrogenase/5,10-methenyltetrahydrofolate cyclohydrolase [Clostridiales bacterium]|nr:bifunctional 5,10-methylenetetrahydrofolate dehydrogenase/5,10-methenyltetrahydrofolate cyclohydrolase [Clostridiales bacterium]